MCDHKKVVLYSDVYETKASKTETLFTKIDILYCEECDDNDTAHDDFLFDKENPSPFPNWCINVKTKKIF